MKSFKNNGSKAIVESLIKIIQDNKDYLGTVDGAIGDGDHGINMNKGFTICQTRLEGNDASFDEAMNMLGDILMSEIGGSMGPIYGTLFIEMASVAEGKDDIDAQTFKEMLDCAIEGLCDLVDARVGDKTLMDVLLPAQEAYDKALEDGAEFDAALDSMVQAANAGRDYTKELVAKFGRASRLGERSRGVLDAGSVSCALIMEGMADAIKCRLVA